MKKRNGFVTNSSSSCFICQISGNRESGMGMSLNDAGMTQCINGHTFNDEYLLDVEVTDKEKINTLIEHHTKEYNFWKLRSIERPSDKDYLAWTEEHRNKIEELESADSIDDYEDEYSELVYDEGVPSIQCPICQFQYGLAEDLLAYLMKEDRINKDDLLTGIKERFGSYTKFREYV